MKNSSFQRWLDEWLSKPDVTDILMNGPNDCKIDQGLGLESVPGPAGSDDDFKEWVIQTISANNRTWDARFPFLDFTIHDKHRFHVVFPPIVGKICISVRCHHSQKQSRWFKDDLYPFLKKQLIENKTMIISGATGSGKTTLIRELIEEIPSDHRILCLEDTAEIQSQHPGFVSLVSREANPDGYGEISLGDLIRQSLRMRPDRIVLGECRGKEVFYLLQALNSGHRGSLSSIHANSNRDAIRRLELLCQLESKGAPSPHFLRDLISSGIQYLVHLRRFPKPSANATTQKLAEPSGDFSRLEITGRDDRVISEISEICGIEGNTILLRQLAEEGKWIHSKNVDSIRSERTILFGNTKP